MESAYLASDTQKSSPYAAIAMRIIWHGTNRGWQATIINYACISCNYTSLAKKDDGKTALAELRNQNVLQRLCWSECDRFVIMRSSQFAFSLKLMNIFNRGLIFLRKIMDKERRIGPYTPYTLPLCPLSFFPLFLTTAQIIPHFCFSVYYTSSTTK
jgi:hypothetical protein